MRSNQLLNAFFFSCGVLLQLHASELPNTELVDQNGKTVRFLSDVVQDRTVAVSFIFTNCTTICPTIGVTLGKLQRILDAKPGNRTRLISISVDPVNDTPERLRAWSNKFGGGWTLLTGEKRNIDATLKALGVFTSDKLSHNSSLLIGRNGAEWKRMNALGPVSEISGALSASTPPESGPSRARHYFSDVELIDQNGRRRRLYSDLLQNRVVVVNAFFTTCTDSCPVMAANFSRLRKALASRAGKDLFFLSLSVDPETDSPERLRQYAQRFGASDSWTLLTGPNIPAALAKFGFSVRQKQDHSNLFIIGNESTGLWKKAIGMKPAEEILAVVESVLNDNGRP